ncbi:MAG TPA: DUF6265 family protein [Flavobacteriales bacterium]|nr:DUF6265 family protein [Flavobacteriales bacterium]
MRKYFICVVPFALFTACSGEKEKKEDEPVNDKPAKEETVSLNSLNWILGSWKNDSPEISVIEAWEITNDSTWTGMSYGIQKNDTVFSESIVLEKHGKDLFYIPTVKDQNEGKPVEFKMTQMNENEVIFENPRHDFPQKIHYKKISADSVVAEVSGTHNGKPAMELFPMKRVK